jgi:hypothetical protein
MSVLVEFKIERQPMHYARMLLNNHLLAKKIELTRYQHNEDIANAIRLDIEDLTRALSMITE